MYFMTAYFAIRAPKIPGTKTRGPIRLHKALAWIHGPGMILTPILGAMAFAQKSRGEKVHGIARRTGRWPSSRPRRLGWLLLPYRLNSERHMISKTLMAFLLLALPALAAADSQWVLDQSTLTYHVSHPLHQVEGVSHAAKGKGVCHAGQCDFLIAVPVKSFDSGDSNRDLHMLQVTRGAQFPIVTVRTRLPEAAIRIGNDPCRSGDPVRRPDRRV